MTMLTQFYATSFMTQQHQSLTNTFRSDML